MSDLLRGAFCPKCRHLLYTVTLDDGARGWVQRGVKLRQDPEGHFVVCGSCAERIGLVRTIEMPGWGFDLA
jgi:hypothetical protein